MTHKEYLAKLVRKHEISLGVPSGWWGTYNEINSPSNRVRVTMRSWVWTIYRNSVVVSRHDSRTFAIKKARKIEEAGR